MDYQISEDKEVGNGSTIVIESGNRLFIFRLSYNKDELEGNDKEFNNKLSITNKYKKMPDFKYEYIIYMLLDRMEIVNLVISIDIVDEITDFDLFSSLIFLIDYKFKLNLKLQKNNNHFSIKQDNKLIMESFI